ncbi:barstar family protein [Rhodococcus sp. NPDC058514]|uniref:barstar family protein n=1 Tax=unclassified Rhodococcus (in: high G+C Gram-positive bacteria) TaxID=192944 RepID=UPI003649A8AC
MTTVDGFITDRSGLVAGLLTGSAPVGDTLAYALSERGYTVRVVRAAKMRTAGALFDEFAAALQFPYYFGANKDAFDECLRDVDDWLGESPGLVLMVRDAGELLADEPGQLGWFVDAVEDGARDRTGGLLRVILQADRASASALARRWTSAGGALAWVEP